MTIGLSYEAAKKVKKLYGDDGVVQEDGYERSWLAMGRQRGWRVKMDGDQVFITAAASSNPISIMMLFTAMMMILAKSS